MKRLVFLGLILVTLSPVLAQQVHVIDRDQVNIRADATTQSRQISALRRGTEVVELDRAAGWLKIELPDGSQGWVHGKLVLPRFLVSGQGVRLREGPSTGRTSVTMLFRGQEVDRVGPEQGGWSQVRIADGRTGWLATRFLKSKVGTDLARPAQPSETLPEPSRAQAEEPLEALPELPEDEIPVRVQRNPYAEGLQHEAGGDHQRALILFEETLSSEPDNVNALFHAAKAYRHLGEYDQALAKLYHALDVSGGRRDIHLTLGEVYRLKAMPDSAAKYQALFRGEMWPPPQTPAPRTEGVMGDTPVERNVAGPDSGTEPAGNPLDGPWVLIGLAGVGLLALAGITWWVVNTSQKKPAKSPAVGGEAKSAGGGKFAGVLEHQADAAVQGAASTEEEESLDRQIDEKWNELRQGASAASGGEEGEMDRILDQVESLRQTLDGQDERSRLYADIVRLQNMKIEAMTDEIRRLRGRRS